MTGDSSEYRVCPECGATLPIRRSGRKKLNIPFKNVCEALKACITVWLAAEKLGCSVGYIYQELNKKGLKPKDIIGRNEKTILSKT